ncbi:MAG: hypothetical protein NT155_00215 [Candidatus Staskawiczbacteria bacterium]|nr:hypothetical protein [Candidatus Staskawiczbacteria bacterium]
MFNNYQKGVSLIITFFIMLIALAVVLTISTILYSEIKVIKSVGNSVIAFYAADSGIEKVLYYDRQTTPAGAARGLCSLCASCSTAGDDCTGCTPSSGCADACTGACTVSFKTTVGDQNYNINANVSAIPGGQCGLSAGAVSSYGFYKNTTTRAVQLDVSRQIGSALGPNVTDKSVFFTGGNVMHVTANVAACKRDVDSVIAYITNNQNSDVVTLLLSGGNNGNCQGVYENTWSGGTSGVTYYVSIATISTSGYCASVATDPVQQP